MEGEINCNSSFTRCVRHQPFLCRDSRIIGYFRPWIFDLALVTGPGLSVNSVRDRPRIVIAVKPIARGCKGGRAPMRPGSPGAHADTDREQLGSQRFQCVETTRISENSRIRLSEEHSMSARQSA